MRRKRPLFALFTASVALILAFTLIACSPAAPATTTPTPGADGGTIVNSDSIVTAKIQAIRKQSIGYPWELDVLIENSVDVDSLVNPVRDSVGKVIVVEVDQDMTPFKIGDVVTARIKYAGDVPEPGIVLYMYDVAPEIKP